MKKCLLAVWIVCLLFTFSLAHASNFRLPQSLENSFNKACVTEDAFIKQAVRDQAKQDYPRLVDEINNYWSLGCIQAKEQAKIAKQKEIEEAIKVRQQAKVEPKDKKTKNWSGSIEAGLSVALGNTKEQDMNLASKLVHDTKNWKNILSFQGVNKEKNRARIAEEYRVSGTTRMKWKGHHYFFADLNYVNDRFSGYTYRVSETAGYGYSFIDNDKTTLEAEYSIGGRQSELIDETKENSLLNKFAARFKHDLTKRIVFSEELTVSLGDDTTITESDSTLKTKLTDGLYLKLGYNVEHISDVPANSKNMDILTTVNIGYDF